MSLKTDYLDGANGYTTKMAAVFAAGEQFVVDNRATLQSELEAQAAQGVKTFDVTVITVFETAYLRLEGNHMNTFFSGIKAGLFAEDIYEQEVSLSLDTSDTVTTSVIFSFTL